MTGEAIGFTEQRLQTAVQCRMGLPSFALRRCPECTGPNDFLEWQATSNLLDRPESAVSVLWLRDPPMLHQHMYRCRRCGHEYQWETLSANPDVYVKR